MRRTFATLTVCAVALTCGPARSAELDIVDTAVSAKSFNTLVAAVKAAGLVETLKGDGPFTVFAPTDDAFAKLPKGTLESLLKPENKDQLTAILTYHVVPGKVLAKDVVTLDSAKTVNGAEVAIRANDKGVFVNDSQVVKTDILTSNGVIHVIDSVLLPPEKPMKAAEAARMLEHSVARGVRMFNAGHHGECAAIYMEAMQTLSSQPVEGLCGSTQRMMTTLAEKAGHERHATNRAWMLRRGIDAVHMQLTMGR